MTSERFLPALSKDPMVRGAALAALALLALYLLPVFGAETVAFLDEFVTVPVLLVAILVGTLVPSLRAGGAERRFWALVAAAFGSWIAAEMTLIFLFVRHPDVELSILTDFAHCLYFACMALAIEMRPHRAPGARPATARRVLSAAGAMVFLVGMLVYFVIIPAFLDADSYTDLFPSYLLYIGLDLYLALRFLALFRDADSRRWRAVYGLLCVMGLLAAGCDCLELLNLSEVITVWRSSPWSLLWYPPYFAALLAVRARLLPDDRPAREREETAPAGPSLVYYLVALPAIHSFVHVFGLVGPASQPAHEALVLVLLAVLGALTVAQELVQRRERRRLRADLEETRTELQRARRLEAIGRLAGAVAHDFNNLLTAIRGSTDLLRSETAGRPEADALCDTIDKAADHAGALTHQLLAFGRRQSLQPVALDLNDVVTDDRELLAKVAGRGVTVRVVPRARSPWVLFDPAQIHGVLVNLAANARDAMPQGGSLTIETRDAHGDGAEPSGDRVVLEVTDTGHGIDPDDLDRIFEPFFTTKARGRGTGLGLATVYGIVEQSGGRIEVDSRPGAGTTFRVFLQRTDAPVARTEPVPPARTPESAPTVLVVDDDRDVRALVAAFLDAEGYRVLTAEHGQAALDVAGRESGPIHLLLTDVVMPVMDGPTLAGEVAARWPETRILFMSGHTGGQALTARGPGPSGPLLHKPFGKATAVAAVRAALEPRAAEPRRAARETAPQT